MALSSIDVKHLRNISHAKLQFSPGLNLIIGLNASGKTSLLEAISLICQGRSFRTNRIDQLIQQDQEELIVVADIHNAQHKERIGLSRKLAKTLVKINGQHVNTTTDLASRIPFFVLRPESHELLDSGPKMRRQYLDWGVFHVEHHYLTLWKDYHRILRQRNLAIRRRLSKPEIQAWLKPLVEKAVQLHQYRVDYIEKLAPYLADYGQLLTGESPAFDYYPGWSEDATEKGLTAQLNDNLEQDIERGFTQYGPQRADIRIKIRKKPVQTIFSRGQQKLLICAMTLAQLQQHPKHSILLVDDLPAELDPEKRAILLSLLSGLQTQVFVTATEERLIDETAWSQKAVFHVKQGTFQLVEVI